MTFRYDEDELDDAVLQALPDDLFKARVNLLCLQARLQSDWTAADVVFHLRRDPLTVDALLWLMRDYGLIEERATGRYTMTTRAQRKASSTERMRKLRARRHEASQVTRGDAPFSLAAPAEIVTAPRPKVVTPARDVESEERRAIRSHASITAIRIASLCFKTPQDWPMGWANAEASVFRWMLERKWEPTIMLAACQKAMAAKQDGPPESIAYFEEFIAKAHAPRSADHTGG